MPTLNQLSSDKVFSKYHVISAKESAQPIVIILNSMTVSVCESTFAGMMYDHKINPTTQLRREKSPKFSTHFSCLRPSCCGHCYVAYPSLMSANLVCTYLSLFGNITLLKSILRSAQICKNGL